MPDMKLVVVPNDTSKVAQYKGELDIKDSTSVISWGTGVQKKLSQVNSQMLDGVRAKDAGAVGESLVSMVSTMRGLDFSKAAGGNKVGFLGKLMGKIAPLAEFIQSYESISSQVNGIADKLENHRVELMKSVKQLDLLYTTTLEYFHELGNYVAAGEEIIKELDEVKLPAAQAKAVSGEMLDAQEYNDLLAARDAFDRRLNDIRLTRQVVMQSLPQIRMVQTNDTDLIQKIQTQIINTIPMWESQMVIAVEQWKLQEATKTTKAVSDLQNELLVKNAEMLKQGNAEARKEIERGVYDIESVKKANDLLIATIEESISMSNVARNARANVAKQLVESEDKLKAALVRAA